jgi:hypothetical protein
MPPMADTARVAEAQNIYRGTAEPGIYRKIDITIMIVIITAIIIIIIIIEVTIIII